MKPQFFELDTGDANDVERKPQVPKEPPEQSNPRKIFTAIVSCNGVDRVIEYTWEEFDRRYNPQYFANTENREEKAWDPESQALIDWFLNSEVLPNLSFQLDQGQKISDPSKFYSSLKKDIADGPSGCRACFGALQSDLKKLKKFVDNGY